MPRGFELQVPLQHSLELEPSRAPAPPLAADFGAASPAMPDSLQGAWELRRSVRARRLSVRVFRDGRVEVVAPRRASLRSIGEFVRRHGRWIERQRREAQRDQAQHLREAVPPTSLSLPALGETWTIRREASAPGGRGRALVRSGPCELSWRAPELPEAQAARKLLQWLLAHARPALAAQLAVVAQQTGLRPAGMSLRRQRTRWGSCSTRGIVSLNVCLVFQTPEVLRYLLIHELTHLEHMNHSSRFWSAVERRCPDWRRLDAELSRGWRNVPQWVFR